MVREGVRTDSLKGRRGRLPSKPKSPVTGATVGAQLQVMGDALVSMMANHAASQHQYPHHQQQQQQQQQQQHQHQQQAAVMQLHPQMLHQHHQYHQHSRHPHHHNHQQQSNQHLNQMADQGNKHQQAPSYPQQIQLQPTDEHRSQSSHINPSHNHHQQQNNQQQQQQQQQCQIQSSKQQDLNSTSSESHGRAFYDTYQGDSTESDYEDNMLDDASLLQSEASDFNGLPTETCNKWT